MSSDGFDLFENDPADPDATIGNTADEHTELERLSDDLLNGDLSRERSAEFFRQLSLSPEAARDLATTHRAIDALSEPVPTPDFTGCVLGEVRRRRGFVSGRGRRWVWAACAAIAAALIVTAGIGFGWQRATSDAAVAEGKPDTVMPLLAQGVRQDLSDVSIQAAGIARAAGDGLRTRISLEKITELAQVREESGTLARGDSHAETHAARMKAGFDQLLGPRLWAIATSDDPGVPTVVSARDLVRQDVVATDTGRLKVLRGHTTSRPIDEDAVRRIAAAVWRPVDTGLPAEVIDSVVPQSVFDGHSGWVSDDGMRLVFGAASRVSSALAGFPVNQETARGYYSFGRSRGSSVGVLLIDTEATIGSQQSLFGLDHPPRSSVVGADR